MANITSPNGYIFYHYIPSQAGAIVVCTLFALGTLAVFCRMIKTRSLFAIPFIAGCIFEVIGYVCRAIAKDTEDSPLIPFILQNVLLLVAPALFAASIYMTLGRVICSVHGEHHSIIKAQASGGGLQAGKKFNKNTARYIIIVGLVVQVVGFGLFAITASIWHVRMKRTPTKALQSSNHGNWQNIMYMLCAVSVLIFVRSVFRVIEYVMGNDSYLFQHEWPLYIFDAVLMMATVAVFSWFYPGGLRYTKVVKHDSDGPALENGILMNNIRK